MNKKVFGISAILLFAALGGAAQDLSKVQRMPATVFDVPFSFYADKQLLPAGTYEIRPNFMGTDIEVRNVKGDKIVLVRAITSLSPRPLDHADLAFDVVGKDHYLSEFYLPGVDGMAFNGAQGTHKHEIVVAAH